MNIKTISGYPGSYLFMCYTLCMKNKLKEVNMIERCVCKECTQQDCPTFSGPYVETTNCGGFKLRKILKILNNIGLYKIKSK